jgi:glycosyltransferase involved in cell wall biosynthesis
VKLCFLVSEYFGWGKYGGYGTSTRLLAMSMASRGFEVTVLTPRRGDQPPQETIDGVRVIAYPPYKFGVLRQYCRDLGADIYHSHEPSMATVMARRAMPNARHIVTCRDTRLIRDWLIEMGAWIRDGSYRTLASFPYENNPWVTRAVRAADGVYCPNHFSRDIARKKYSLAEKPAFLPSPIRTSSQRAKKAATPTVCHLGRWDTRKRPELFFELAAQFPQVNFLAIGRGRTDQYDRELKERYGDLPNLELTGFIDQFESPRLFELLSTSWILVNTAMREGLPRSFMEAAVNSCAILSRVDPDRFASRFGFCAKRDNFAEGLRWLLSENRWRLLGEEARDYVAGTYGLESAVAAHVAVYESAIGKTRVKP